MKQKTLQLIKFFLGWPLSILALVSIIRIISLNGGKVYDYLVNIHLFFLFLSIICFLIYYIFRCLFWKKLLQMQGYVLSLKEVVYLWELSEIKRYIPGGVWSFLGRTAAFSLQGIKKSVLVRSLIIESEFLVLASAAVSFIAYPFIYHVFFSFLPKIAIIYYGFPLIFFFLLLIFLGNFVYVKKSTRIPGFIVHILPSFSLSQNLQLLFLSLVYMLFFGLGTYFSIHSLFFLNPQLILTLIGIFVFSFFVGYISIITPMGLGVREGILTVSLSQFLSFDIAGFASIFCRIILIFAELLFLGLAILWHKTNDDYITPLEVWLKEHVHLVLLFTGVGGYILYFTAASFLRYTNFYTGRFDLGNMDQTVWNTLHGHFFQLTNPDGTNIVSRVSFHADFILILLAPFYLIWQDPRTLLFIQTVVLALGAYFVYAICLYMTKSKTGSLLVSFAYLLNPSVEYSNLYDFHAVTLATTFFLAGYYFFLKKSYTPFLIFLFLAAITKEQVWVVTALFGLIMAIKSFMFVGQKNNKQSKITHKTPKNMSAHSRIPVTMRIGLLLFGISSILFYLIFFRLIPWAHGGNHFALAYYSDFGATPSAIVKSIVFSPQKTFATLFSSDRLEYIKQLFSSVGFLPLLSPLFLLFILPDLSINLLSNNAAFHQIYYQYTAVITPFLFIASIAAMTKITQWKPEITISLLGLYMLMCSILSVYFYGPLPGSQNANLDMFSKPQPYAVIIDNFLQDIPSKYTIAATNNLGSHLSHRQKIFTIPVGIDQADFILFLLNDKFAAPSLQAQKAIAENMKHDKKYIEIFKTGDFVVFEKRNLYVQTEPNVEKIKLFPISVQTLQERDYVGGNVQIIKTVEERPEFTSYIISYASDGLTLHALMNIPKTKKPFKGFPVVFVDHSFFEQGSYDTEKSYKYVTDFFALHGYIVIKPDFRGNGNSERDDTVSNISSLLSYPIDQLNLISSLTAIPDADQSHIFLWGHGLGSSVVLTSLAANNQNPDFLIKIKAGAIWASAIDPYRTFQQYTSLKTPLIPYSHAVKLLGNYGKHPLIWESVSPMYYLDDITSPVQIMHGINDMVIPYQWSIELYNDLISLNKSASLKIYPTDDHAFTTSRDDALNRNLQFFNSFL